MKSSKPPIVATVLVALFPTFVTIAGVAACWHVGPRLLLWLDARSWSTATASIAHTAVREVDMGPATPNSKRWFVVDVSYRYSVAGQEYAGTRIGIWDEHALRPAANTVAAEYEAHPEVDVFFDPAEPSLSLLSRDVGAGTWAIAIAGLIALLLGAVLWIGFVRAVRSPAQPGDNPNV